MAALLSFVILCPSSVSAQKVIFPQEKQPGAAAVSVNGNEYAVSNDLFTAKFIKNDGKLLFNGCSELGLLPGSELFTVQLANGAVIPASEFVLGEVATETLAANGDAVKGAKRFAGVQIKAQFTHANGLGIEWRVVLRDGSHYLRTEVDVTTTTDIAMYNIVPMIYTVENVEGAKAPSVVGNTRGAVILSDKIFAGLETPTAYNTAGEATDVDNFVFKAWDGASSWGWEPASSEIPAGIKNLSQYAEGTVAASRGYLVFREAGECTINLNYTNGNNRLQILGVDILDLAGNVVASDYHFGFTGGAHSNRDYRVNIPQANAYMVRIFVTNAGSGEGFASAGTITYSAKVTKPELVRDLASTETPRLTPEIAADAAKITITPEEGDLTANAGKRTTWTQGLPEFGDWSAALPEGMSTPTAKAIYLDKHYNIKAGNLTVLFDYTGGNHGLNLLGVQLINCDGVVSSDYHVGFTGGSDRNNTYSVTVPKDDAYIVRLFVDRKNDGVNGNGNVDFTLGAVETIGGNTHTDSWTSAWTGFANWDGTLPEGTTAAGTAKYKDTDSYSIAKGELSLLFDYTSGNHGLYMLGVQLVDHNGNVVAEEFKNGFTGSSSTVIYNVTVPESGIYKVRYIADYCNGGTATNGSITYTHTAYVAPVLFATIVEDEAIADAWTPSDWKTLPADEIPNRVNEVGCSDDNARVIERLVEITSPGQLSVEFLYSSGNHRLNLRGYQSGYERGKSRCYSQSLSSHCSRYSPPFQEWC